MPSLLIEVIIRAPDISVPWGPLIGSVYSTLGIITVFAILAWRIGLFGLELRLIYIGVPGSCPFQYIYITRISGWSSSRFITTRSDRSCDHHCRHQHSLCLGYDR